ncbi:MAG: hypothetical protein CEE38_20090 [Planctomycetes bacterium B3_Pla]|nr:MAG: hypothetical protein CEE38_20090 [Planctomycetes bacterium B3_Pla]
MCKKTVYLLALVVMLGSVSNAMTWKNIPHGKWHIGNNWDTGQAPTATDEVMINTGPEGPVITNPGAMCGVIKLGLNGGQGTLFLAGGTIDVGKIFIPGDTSGAFGKLFLQLDTFNVIQSNGLQMDAAGLIDITWGVLVLEGDERDKVNDLIQTTGQITAFEGGGYLEVDFDITNPGKTTVTAIEGEWCPYPNFLCHTVEMYDGDVGFTADGWTITDTPMAREASTWTITNPGGRGNPPTLDGSPSTGKFLISDSDQQSESNPVDSGASHDVSTPSFSTLGSATVWLHVDVSAQLNNNGAAIFDVEVSTDGGDTWANVFSRVAPGRVSSNGATTRPPDNTNADGYFGHLDVDISAVAADQEDVKVRFRHYEPNWDWWIALDNIVVDSVAAPQGGPLTVFSEDFSNGLGQMKAFSGLGNTGTETWHTTDKGGRYVPGTVQEQGVNRLGPHPNEHPEFAIIDSDADPDPNEDEWLMTPSLDLSGLAEVFLHYESETVMSSGVSNQEVLVSLDGGSTFETAPIFAYTGGGLFDNGEEPVYAERIFDVSGIAAGESQVVFAFRYTGDGDDWWWAIDNVIVTGTPPEPVDPGTDGLVAFYALDGDANDSSVNGLHGIVVGDPTFLEGLAGMALDLDGVDDYVDCGNDTIFDITDAFTLSVWINWRAAGATWQTVVAKGDNAWRLARGGDTQTMDFGFTDGAARGWLAVRTASEVPLGEWHHVAATINKIDGAKIYLDGVLEGTNTDTGGITVGSYPVLIGENAQATGRYWDGLIDKVAIYSRVLPLAEIRYLGIRSAAVSCCSGVGSRSHFIADFDSDPIGSPPPPPTNPLHYGPPGASLDTQGGSGKIEVVNSTALGSKALKIVRGPSTTEVNAVVGTIDNVPNTTGVYYIDFRAHGEIVPSPFIAGMSISVRSTDNEAALVLRLYDGAYHLAQGGSYLRLTGSYDPSTAHDIHIELDLDMERYCICIDGEVLVSDEPLLASNFTDLHALQFQTPQTITEAFESVYIVDDIRIAK